MKPFKTFALTFFVLALFAANAAAQTCGGKQVYLQLPSSPDWSKTAIYIYGQGSVVTVSGSSISRQGDYVVFTMPTLQNDTQNNPRTFSFSMKPDDLDAGNRWIYAGSGNYDRTGARPSDAQGISCSNFTSSPMYIYPEPGNTSRTVVSAQPPNAYNFYFLPPKGDPAWVLGHPILVSRAEGRTKLDTIKLVIDPIRCGWYKYSWFNATPPNGIALVWLNDGDGDGQPDDQLGLLGLDEDPVDWAQGMPTPFNLYDQFEQKPGDLFFAPSAITESKAVWSKSDQNMTGTCTFNFAAIIYDTDASINTSFFDYDGSASGTGSPRDGSGILRGIVQSTLKDGKIQWKGTSTSTTSFNGANDGWNKDNFEAAFDPKSDKNDVRCYEMPFQRNSEGLWEFDSNKLCSDGSIDLSGACTHTSKRFLGGFFPPMMNDLPNSGTSRQRPAQGWVDFKRSDSDGSVAVSKWCYDRGYLGPASVTGAGLTSDQAGARCTRRFTDGDFRNGDNPPDFWDWEGPTNAGLTLRRDGRVNGVSGTGNNASVLTNGPVGAAGTKEINGDGWSNKTMNKNQLFCFESTPADFTYEPKQEFFFSGDDDIWIYISNHLVIDLGGTHLASPGYVNLDTLRIPSEARVPGKKYQSDGKLVEGESYPFNVFFCDRRTTMANVRITTNIYFAQKSMLGIKEGTDAETSSGAQLCLESSGSDGSCQAALNGSNSNQGPQCGAEMGDILDYYILNRRGEKIPLNTSNDNCNLNNGNLVCYGGITLTNWPTVDRIRLRTPIAGFIGTQRIYASIKPSKEADFPNATPVFITSFVGETSLNAVWGKIVREDNGQLIYNLGPRRKETVSGKLVPIGFASGAWECDDESRYGNDDCPFAVVMANSNEGGSYGAPVQIKVDANPGERYWGLTAYTDSIPSDNNVVQLNSSFQVPSPGEKHFPGLLVLWVAGEYRAQADETYTINNDLEVKVFLPRLGFINPETDAALSQTKGSDPSLGGGARQMGVMIGTNLSRAVAAYDISNNQRSVCTTCNFPLTMNAWTTTPGGATTDIPSGQIMQSTPGVLSLEDGIAKFSVRGARQVDPDSFAHFTIRGPSTKEDTYAKWDSLLFSKPDAPFPQVANIYDRNGDGIGDSLYIQYDRKFPADSLPSAIEIIWDFKDTLVFTTLSGKQGGEYVGSNINPNSNREYWNGERNGFRLSVRESGDYGIIEIHGGEFSNGIKTFAGERASIVSWATFKDSKKQDAVTHLSMGQSITDKIPAIVTKAIYTPDENNKCGTYSTRCRDDVRIMISEPVKLVEGVSDPMAKAPFAYKLRGRDWAAYRDQKDLPTGVRWAKSGTVLNAERRDSVVTLSYQSYKEPGDTTFTPVANDSVKFVAEILADYSITDLAGNAPNPKEIGRRLEGTNRFNIDEIRIAEIDPAGEDILKKDLESLKGGDNSGYGLLRNVDVDKLFATDKQVTFLPVPEEWAAAQSPPDSIKKYYRGSVGQLLVPDVYSNINLLQDKHLNPGSEIDPEGIVFHAQAFYHTNLGNFTAESKPIQVKCTDPIFQINGQGNCLSNRTAMYLAWNLRDNKDRWVGAGAYVQVYDFRWTVKFKDKNGKDVSESFNKVDKRVEMLGVRRAKK
ncbi:MAG: fibro-slime domain-containing protein [Fibromonadales bacterium]|nr:fibro-slime domain-containing protein [Fibromonadales bacterium]